MGCTFCMFQVAVQHQGVPAEQIRSQVMQQNSMHLANNVQDAADR